MKTESESNMKQKQSTAAATATAVEKLQQQADSAKNRTAIETAIVSIAAKLRKNKESKLSLSEIALCIACKFSNKLSKLLTIDSFFELINSSSKLRTHKSSTAVLNFNRTATAAKKMTDVRYALYQTTVALYDKSSQFAAKFICFAVKTNTSVSAHSSKKSTRTLAVITCKVFKKVAAKKSLATDVKLLARQF